MMLSVEVMLLVSIMLRLCLIVYGEWQDRSMAVKFTDVDYFVFNDAASYVTQGKSPYLRATYRYTPLLAWMLQPNILVSPVFGKLLFIIMDVYTGYLIYNILCTTKGVTERAAKLCAAFWLFNPLSMTVSSRGNAEAIMTSLVLLCLKLLKECKVFSAALVFSLAIHFKLYPITYAIPIYLLFGKGYHQRELRVMPGFWETIFDAVKPTKARVMFVVTSGITMTLLTAVFYQMYGWEFLHHTYLYHVTRKDIRHNFSVYFYMLYQQSGVETSLILALLCFIPQVLLLLVFSFKFYREPALVFFLNTFAFVTFNKVCTSQYFLWYLCLLPLLIPHLTKMSLRKAVVLMLLWFAGQGLWLLPAYYLEFQGVNTFLYIWLAGLVFFAINCYILIEVISSYSSVPYAHEKSKASRERTPSYPMISEKLRDTQSELTDSSNVKSEKVTRTTRSETRKRNKIK